MTITKDAMMAMESVMSYESIAQSDAIYESQLFILKLAELREQYNIKQTDIKSSSQPSISRIKDRNDIKLSTVIKYLTQMDLEMEIKVRPRHPGEDAPSELMLFHT